MMSMVRQVSRRFSLILALGITLQSFSLFAQDSASVQSMRSQSMSVSAIPQHLVNGGPVFFRVKTSSPLQSLQGNWLGPEIVFDKGEGNTWFLLAAVSLSTPPGQVPLTLQGTTDAGTPVEFRHEFVVTK